MLRRTPPMSNTERQRQFRKRNPGYYQRLHARRRAAVEAHAAQRLAAAQVKVAQREPLALPAPVVMIQIPVMERVPAVLVASPPPVLMQLPMEAPASPLAATSRAA